MLTLPNEWAKHTLSGSWKERYVYRAVDKDVSVRIMRRTPHDQWLVRWTYMPGDDVYLPADMPLEEAQAMAIALWRLS